MHVAPSPFTGWQSWFRGHSWGSGASLAFKLCALVACGCSAPEGVDAGPTAPLQNCCI